MLDEQQSLVEVPQLLALLEARLAEGDFAQAGQTLSAMHSRRIQIPGQVVSEFFKGCLKAGVQIPDIF